MFLKSIDVQNFRGIPKARLTLDETTILIGENDSGKTSLLDALSKVLTLEDDGIPQFHPYHFYHSDREGTPAGSISIELVFEERKKGEWIPDKLGVIASLFNPQRVERKQIRFRMTADPPWKDEIVTGRWRIQAVGGTSCWNCKEALKTIRELFPLVWLKGGSLLAAPPRTRNDEKIPIEPYIEKLADDIEKHYEALISGKSRQPKEELKAGFEAARSLLTRRSLDPQLSSSQPGSTINEILGGERPQSQRRLKTIHGSAAHQIGVLILTAAVLRQVSFKALQQASPIMVIEDPEAGLHLRTLSSIWGLLEQVRAQKIITTQSGILLSAAPLHQVRRISRAGDRIRQWLVRKKTLSRDDLRKISYHLRIRRGDANFARCWLLVEGETEFWLLPELARACGYSFDLEGVTCLEFAQCGLEPLIKVAREWGIKWHVMVDGDQTGLRYAETVRRFIDSVENESSHLTTLHQQDIEHCFWDHGYSQVFLDAINPKTQNSGGISKEKAIRKAVDRHSKPYLAFELIESILASGSPGVPSSLSEMIETCIRLARGTQK